MSESRKNHLSIDGGQVKEDDRDHVATYKPILEAETETRPKSLSKSKEKLSDEAEEKLLQKEDEAKIVTRVDMADAKFVVGDHRNGDAKIELDANKRQFSGLTKEELLKYADDPFWVRLRWVMFAAFWLLWLGMLAGAIAIIVRAPKCAPPQPKAWFEIGPLADHSSANYEALEADLPKLAQAKVQGVFITPCENTYEVLESTSCLEQFKEFLTKAQEKSIKLLVDLTANYVPTSHAWFTASENRSAEFTDYFVWSKGQDYDTNGKPKLPNNWVSLNNEPAWQWSPTRQEYYLSQYGSGQADLNFHNKLVVERFDAVLRAWNEAGASGVRLQKARQLLVNSSLPDEPLATVKESRGATVKQYGFLRHSATSDQPALNDLFAHWAHIVTGDQAERVFTLKEDGSISPEWFLLGRNTPLRPASAAPVAVQGDLSAVAKLISDRLTQWPIMQLWSGVAEGASEVSRLAMLLPATPLLAADQLDVDHNTTHQSESFSTLSTLRGDASLQHGQCQVTAVTTNGSEATMLAVARWKSGHSGYVAVYNPSSTARANLSAIPSVPATLTVYHVSPLVGELTNYTNNLGVSSSEVLVPKYSTVVLSYVPLTTAEQ